MDFQTQNLARIHIYLNHGSRQQIVKTPSLPFLHRRKESGGEGRRTERKKVSLFDSLFQEWLWGFSHSRLFANANLVLINTKGRHVRNNTNKRKGRLEWRAGQSFPISHYLPLAIPFSFRNQKIFIFSVHYILV